MSLSADYYNCHLVKTQNDYESPKKVVVVSNYTKPKYARPNGLFSGKTKKFFFKV